ncbi:hypothetical protein G6F46_015391 [Rhizopus delemar]|uniref:Uncharacterized protein n=1 Tax=Rhizopus delemar TaxID=936053 RepID=A0A9P7BZA3_9FUNG|nr:hypothetical protein G6F59_018515 [Rhizopus arrhizus]KAG1529740.1 hypothetical protein G6F50_017791 [Rhizopus delemar]KAG1581242.1 hypothetical protein G6F46_015391 [Rhizopus delemar]
MCFGFLGIQFGAVDRSAADRPAGAAGGWLPVRPHLDALGPPPSVLHDRCGADHAGAAGDAELAHAVDRRRHIVGAGRFDQRIDGAVPRLRR